MARYIDADALIAKAERVYNYGLVVSVDDINDAPTVIEGIVGEIPSADVAPVKHGEWLKANPYNRFMDCSVCGFFQDHTEFNYCPNCGARMDGGKG